MEDILVLDGSAYVNPAAEKVTDGRSALTHIANIFYNGKIQQFYLKLFATHKQLCNEITAYLAAKTIKEPVAEHACVIKVPSSIIELLSNGNAGDVVPYAWATSVVSGPTPNTYVYNSYEWNLALAHLRAIPSITNALAFDSLIANEDRNAGNIMLSSNLKSYVLIDHDQAPFEPNWNADDLVHDKHTVCKLSDMLWSNKLPREIRSGIVHASSEHSYVINEFIKQALPWWEALLARHEVEHLKDFYTKRAQFHEQNLMKKMNLLC
ncbi:HipA family kinase [Glaciecola siphonariae]|uniref:HipA family kinase n=1 Tax=Glaciecola siphonariae TaxID=521012 RepID=A0ABV9LTS5_9ALTE